MEIMGFRISKKQSIYWSTFQIATLKHNSMEPTQWRSLAWTAGGYSAILV
jgi:hypothetical protein